MADHRALLGTDLKLDYALRGLFEDADLATAVDTASSQRDRDLETAAGVDAIEQAIVNRLKTRRGELAALGHSDYGSRHHELIGEPNVERTRNRIKLYILQALRHEPRIERVLSADVRPDHDPPREVVRITIEAKLIGEHVPLNLVVPFSLEVGA